MVGPRELGDVLVDVQTQIDEFKLCYIIYTRIYIVVYMYIPSMRIEHMCIRRVHVEIDIYIYITYIYIDTRTNVTFSSNHLLIPT